MNGANHSKVCARAEDLISFLYGELDEREARSFEQHRLNCQVCESELMAFDPIRRSIVAWRDKSLGLDSIDSAAAAGLRSLATQGNSSALAALRSFFAQSPIWLKGATAVATVVLFVLAGLTIARLLEGSQPTPVQEAATKFTGESEEEMKRRFEAEVERRVQMEIEAWKSQTRANLTNRQMEQLPAGPGNRPTHAAGATSPSQKLRKPLTRAEREQLAADLRLLFDEEEDALQLLGDRINR